MPADSVEDALFAEHLVRGELDAAAAVLLRTYGSEVYRFLLNKVRDAAMADDAYSRFAESVWLSLEGFERRSSPRVWAYAIALNAARQEARAGRRRDARFLAWTTSAACGAAAHARTQTVEYLRTQNRERIDELRDELPDADRELLLLRVREGFSWDHIAELLGDTGAAGKQDRAKESARLRKRFQLIKDRLREAAIARGIVPPKDEG